MTDYAKDERLLRAVARHPRPLLFATISGAHLYGFPSPDSDYDLRGAHVLALDEVIGLDRGPDTLESEGIDEGVEMDIVTHDAAKFFELLLKKNGYVLEQLHSPLIVVETPEHAELKAIAAGCVTRHHASHYVGFFNTQWTLLAKEDPPRVKPLLYVYRVLLTGIHLMRTGATEANLRVLNEEFGLPFIAGLIERKIHGAEQGILQGADVAFHRTQCEKLLELLEFERGRSSLPEQPSARPALNDLLIRIRKKA